MIIRKSAFDKSESKSQKLYIDAVNGLIKSGVYTKYVNWHAQMDKYRMHAMGYQGRVGMWRFLAWHRIYLVRFEQELRKVKPGAYIPYWKWVDGGVPDWMKSFMPTVPNIKQPSSAARTVTVKRNNMAPAITTQREIDQILAKTKFSEFSLELERGPHNKGHRDLGVMSGGNGPMATAISPADPMFWLHHANVDRIWALWQVKHPSSPAKPQHSPDIPEIGVTTKEKKKFEKTWEMLEPFKVHIDKAAVPTNILGYKYV